MLTEITNRVTAPTTSNFKPQVVSPFAANEKPAEQPKESVEISTPSARGDVSVNPTPEAKTSLGSKFLLGGLTALTVLGGMGLSAPAMAATQHSVSVSASAFHGGGGGGGGHVGGGGGGSFHPAPSGGGSHAPSGGGGFHAPSGGGGFHAPSGGGGSHAPSGGGHTGGGGFHPAPGGGHPSGGHPVGGGGHPVGGHPVGGGGHPGGGHPGGGHPGGGHPGGGGFHGPAGGFHPVPHPGGFHPGHPIFHPGHDGEWHNRPIDIDGWGGHWGPRWGGPWGFYGGGSFWLGFTIGNLVDYDLWASQPIYIVSPVSGYNVGELQPPVDDGLPAQTQMQLQVLNGMARPPQDPSQPDPSAGLYQAQFDGSINTANPGAKLSGPGAFNDLRNNQPVYFHAPNGAFKKLNNLGDINAYLYAQQSEAPPGTAVLPQ